MLEFGGFIVLTYLFYRYVFNRKPKEERLPTSDELIEKYGLLDDYNPEETYQEAEKPHITINIQQNITHNHLHITPEGNQHH